MTATLPTRSPRPPQRALLQGLMFTYLGFLILLPIAGLLLEAASRPWAELWTVITSELAFSTYRLTFGCALLAASINSIFGLILAWILVRYTFPGKRLADGLIDLPFAMPSVVAGMTLVVLYGPGGAIGQFFDPGTPLGHLFAWFGIERVNLASSVAGIVMAQIFVTLPFVVRTVQPVLMEMEPGVEEAARTLGATAQQTFWRVILPPLFPALLTGFTLAFARAVGEYGVVVLLSGNIPYETLVASVYVYRLLEEFNYAGATAVALVLLLSSLIFLVCTNLLQAWSRRYERRLAD